MNSGTSGRRALGGCEGPWEVDAGTLAIYMMHELRERRQRRHDKSVPPTPHTGGQNILADGWRAVYEH